jgi:hypothetical protein
MTTTVHPLVAILKKLNVTVNVISRPTRLVRDAEGWEYWNWVVRLERRNEPASNLSDGYTTDITYKMGSGHVEELNRQDKMHQENLAATVMPKPKAPDVATVVHSLVLDSSACDNSHADWCANFGYDEDSRKAMDIYLACQRNGTTLRKFFGKDFEAVKEAAQDY